MEVRVIWDSGVTFKSVDDVPQVGDGMYLPLVGQVVVKSVVFTMCEYLVRVEKVNRINTGDNE